MTRKFLSVLLLIVVLFATAVDSAKHAVKATKAKKVQRQQQHVRAVSSPIAVNSTECVPWTQDPVAMVVESSSRYLYRFDVVTSNLTEAALLCRCHYDNMGFVSNSTLRLAYARDNADWALIIETLEQSKYWAGIQVNPPGNPMREVYVLDPHAAITSEIAPWFENNNGGVGFGNRTKTATTGRKPFRGLTAASVNNTNNPNRFVMFPDTLDQYSFGYDLFSYSQNFGGACVICEGPVDPTTVERR